MSVQPSHNKVIGKLLILVFAMFGFGFALVPLYDVFCDVTGLNGKTGGQVAAVETPVIDLNRVVKVQFVASLNANMPWEFKPMTRSMQLHPGESATVDFYARNTSQVDIIGQAVPSVTPGLAASYFQKTECFCFTEQKLAAGEERRMPVIFRIDNALPDDIHELTLSYTFFIKPSTEMTSNNVSLNNNQENSL